MKSDDLALKFINEVLNPLLKEYSFIDTELNGGNYSSGLVSSFIELMENNGFGIVDRETNELIFLYELEELRGKLWKPKYF